MQFLILRIQNVTHYRMNEHYRTKKKVAVDKM
jgi:hypothetical protein